MHEGGAQDCHLASAAAGVALGQGEPVQTKEERNARARARRAKQREEALAELALRYVTSAELNQQGWTKSDIARLCEPDLIKDVGWGRRFYWLRDRVASGKPPALHKVNPPIEVDLLMAIFAVNRSAKRRRDAAIKLYAGRLHGLANESKRQKELLYRLKDEGIAATYLAGRLQYEGHHGGLAIYRGEGYCFHSTLEPVGEAARELSADDARIFVESKPRTSREARVADAEFTLSSLPGPPMEKFTRLEAPRMAPAPGGRAERSNHRSLDDDDYDHNCSNDDWSEVAH